MPLTVETPIIISQVNSWRIQAIHLSLPRDGLPSCTIEVVPGYDDGTTITEAEVINHRLADQDFLADYTSVLTGETAYDAIKRIAYARLKADGVVPEDAVES